MTNTGMMRSNEREALFLQQQEQERVGKTREQIFRRHLREELEHGRRRIAAHATAQEERVVVGRCPTCGEMLERTVFPVDDKQSVHNT